jgi:hypothetical protein
MDECGSKGTGRTDWGEYGEDFDRGLVMLSLPQLSTERFGVAPRGHDLPFIRSFVDKSYHVSTSSRIPGPPHNL